MNLSEYIKIVPDFPKKGILYRDIQPLLDDHSAFSAAVSKLYSLTLIKPDYYVGIESRGFIFAAALANLYGKGFKMIRKPGKLPGKVNSQSYELEYGTDTLEMQDGKGSVVIVDDIFATGGTMGAAVSLSETSGYEVLDTVAVIDIGINTKHNTKCLISY
jgi:adenine phosphoribosyltransferase|tara:strand:+ start:764 stop:1243 length:480 start_codon:yes stop_codon:yes gene_type:complete